MKERHIKQEYVAEIFKEINEKYLWVGEIEKEMPQWRTSKRMGEFIDEERKTGKVLDLGSTDMDKYESLESK